MRCCAQLCTMRAQQHGVHTDVRWSSVVSGLTSAVTMPVAPGVCDCASVRCCRYMRCRSNFCSLAASQKDTIKSVGEKSTLLNFCRRWGLCTRSIAGETAHHVNHTHKENEACIIYTYTTHIHGAHPLPRAFDMRSARRVTQSVSLSASVVRLAPQKAMQAKQRQRFSHALLSWKLG